MPQLTRRRSTDAPEECWHVYYGDIHAGTIAIRTGNPHVAGTSGGRPMRRIGIAPQRSACRMSFQKFNVIGNRPLDPLGFQVGMLVIFGLEFRALPRRKAKKAAKTRRRQNRYPLR